ALDCAGAWQRIRLRAVGEPHQECELHPVCEDVKRVVEALVCRRTLVVRLHACDVIWFRLSRTVTIWILLFRLGKQFVSDAHLDVVRFAREHRDRLVLSFPTEACDGPVISASIWVAANPESGTVRRCCCLACKNFAVLYRVDQSESEHLQRNPEGHVVVHYLLFEVGLGECALANRRVIFDTIHDPKLMDATVGDRIAGAVAGMGLPAVSRKILPALSI